MIVLVYVSAESFYLLQGNKTPLEGEFMVVATFSQMRNALRGHFFPLHLLNLTCLHLKIIFILIQGSEWVTIAAR